MGFDPDSQIIGTVMRNQRRKLFPDLFDSFSKFLQSTNKDNVYLYCHTSYPDLGWDIPKLLNQYKISSKVLFTYSCAECGHSFPNFFSDARTKCPKCGNFTASFSNVQKGVSYEYLSKVMNVFDLYIQYSNSEGFGLPQVEAAACGVPVMSVDYSAMSSVIRKLGGTPLKPKALYNELETGCDRAVPDNDNTAKQIEKFFEMQETERMMLAKNTRLNFEKYYQWDKTAKKWEDYFDSVELKPSEETWLSAPRIHHPRNGNTENMSNSEYARWLIVNVLGEPERLNTYFESRLIRDLNYAMFINGMGDAYLNEDSFKFLKPLYEPFDRQKAYDMMADICELKNFWENKRKEVIQ